MPGEPPYPNNLRSLRGAAHLTRDVLARRTTKAAKDHPEECRSLSVSAIEKLEAGSNRPRPATARALAIVLGTTIDAIFPGGTLSADFTPNPTGRTRKVPETNDDLQKPQ